MKKNTFIKSILLFAGLILLSGSLSAQQDFFWQTSQAKVLPNGDLEYTPEPYEFVAGESVRYIDFEAGDDANNGESQDAAWKHHPWDPRASGQSKAAAEGRHTYVFKGGVIYRGNMVIPNGAKGTAEDPIRLTTDPSWGKGRAIISGAEVVTGWEKGSHEKMPDADKVWMTEVNFLPRTLWLTSTGGAPERMKLARWPNWEVSDPMDVMGEWPTWDNPRWWTDANKTRVNGKPRHLGIAKDLPKPIEDLKDATVWSEWGIVMGSPYPSHIDAVYPEKNAIAFTDTWAPNAGNEIITGNRYYLENLPAFLDEAGEYWVEKTGNNSARIYVRLPNDADPNQATIEAGRYYDLFAGSEFEHIHWLGLHFRFGNLGWNYNDFTWNSPNLEPAAIKLVGSGDGIVISHNVFDYLPMPVRVEVGGPNANVGTVKITDNRMFTTDQGAIVVTNAAPKDGPMGHLGHVEILRNQMEEIGFRIQRGAHGHCVDLRWPDSSYMAGNFLNRVAGWGLAVFGGKPSGRDGFERPMSRQLIWNNRVEDVLLASNDWGGIETWQGGSHYTYNNVVINAQAFKNWTFKPGNPENTGSFGHAYYMDGSFKNYLFNNIGLGLNNELGTKNVNATAIQNIISFENWYFNNSFHKFAEMTRQQAGDIGRRWYLGNVFSDISKILFRHANPKDTAPDPNASHYTQGSDFTYNTIAYSQNVIWDLTGTVGTFEETGVVYDELQGFSEALEKLNAQASGVGVMADKAPLADPENMNWSPAPGSVALEQNVLVFVPWALGRTVGEWQFTLNQKDPSQVIDEHWFMTAAYANRQDYRETARYPLQGQNISAENYTQGPLSNWTQTALTLNGEDQYLAIAADTLPADETQATQEPAAEEESAVETTTTKIDFGEVEHPVAVEPNGEKYRVKLTLDKAYPNQQVGLHVHWMKSQGWGGFSNVTFPHKLDDRNYVIEVPAKEHAGMASYNLMFYLSPDGSFGAKTAQATVNIGLAGGEQAAAQMTAGIPRNANVTDTSFILEAHIKSSDADGLIAGKMAGSTGYQLKLAGGKPVFTVATGSGSNATLTAETAVNDDQWHYLLGELDRENNKLTLYVDGKQAATQELADFQGSLANSADFLVGGGPDQEHLAGTFDFLRVSLSTLETSQTSIEELHAWQMDGPQYRDFAGNDRRQKNAAGALVE